jgi:ribosomal-protein-alanine N-acetyltransferase
MAKRFTGYVETVEPALVGWVVDRERPHQPVRFTATIDHTSTFATVANLSRPDVAAAGQGGPDCGFAIALPPELFDGQAHDIDFALSNGRKLAFTAWRSPVVLGPVTAGIRPITAADRDALADLLRQTHLENGLEPDAITDKHVADWIGSLVDDAGGLLIGARVGSRLVGYCLLERGRDAASAIGSVGLTVLTHYRRKGIGQQLMRALLAAARDGGEIEQVWLAVEPGNLPARRIYEKLGFVHRVEPPSSLFVPARYIAMLWRPERSDG